MIVTTPAGKEVELRKMKLSDEDILVDAKLAKDGRSTDLLLERTTGLSKEELEDMLLGEGVFLLIELRKLSKGNMFYPKIHCPSCMEQFEQEIDLDTLEIKELDKSKLDDKFQFEITLPISKKKLVMKLLKGKDRPKLLKARKDYASSFMSFLTMLRTVSIEGEKLKRLDWFKDLDIEDNDFIRDEYDKYDCGVETTVECMCPECMTSFDVDIPFDQSFFLQTRRKKKT